MWGPELYKTAIWRKTGWIRRKGLGAQTPVLGGRDKEQSPGPWRWGVGQRLLRSEEDLGLEEKGAGAVTPGCPTGRTSEWALPGSWASRLGLPA